MTLTKPTITCNSAVETAPVFRSLHQGSTDRATQTGNGKVVLEKRVTVKLPLYTSRRVMGVWRCSSTPLILNICRRQMWVATFITRPLYPQNKMLCGRQIRSGRLEGDENPLSPYGNQTRFLGRPALSLAPIPTTLSRLSILSHPMSSDSNLQRSYAVSTVSPWRWGHYASLKRR